LEFVKWSNKDPDRLCFSSLIVTISQVLLNFNNMEVVQKYYLDISLAAIINVMIRLRIWFFFFEDGFNFSINYVRNIIYKSAVTDMATVGSFDNNPDI
jgi:hypothetical protein